MFPMFSDPPFLDHLTPHEIASVISGTPRGFIRALGGLAPEEVFTFVDQSDICSPASRVLFIHATAETSAEIFVADIVSSMAATALKVWPRWYEGTEVDFGICGNDALGRQAIAVLSRDVSKNLDGVQPLWTEEAARVVLCGLPPLIRRFPLRTQFEQLAKAIAPAGLVLVVAYPGKGACGDAYVHALEWLAQSCGVVALFDRLPANEPPFERILHHACVVRPGLPSPSSDEKLQEPWLAPWRGSPHPMSDIEKKMAAMLAADAELGALFAFNQTVATAHGSKPRVDLLWSEGRLVVELDGYESHGGRSAFTRDRHRDYELMASGYMVLRLANDEIAQDYEKALEKIRDLARLRRRAMTMEV